MAGSFLKANIRLDKIHTRNMKPHYKHLTPKQYRFVKAYEAVIQFEKEIWHLDIRRVENWRKTPEGQELLERYLKAVEKKMRLSNKLDLTEKQENELYHSCHTSRFYGGSF